MIVSVVTVLLMQHDSLCGYCVVLMQHDSQCSYCVVLTRHDSLFVLMRHDNLCVDAIWQSVWLLCCVMQHDSLCSYCVMLMQHDSPSGHFTVSMHPDSLCDNWTVCAGLKTEDTHPANDNNWPQPTPERVVPRHQFSLFSCCSTCLTLTWPRSGASGNRSPRTWTRGGVY